MSTTDSTLTQEKLEEIHKELMKCSVPVGDLQVIVFLNRWERIVSFFSARIAFRMYADRAIREWAKRGRTGPWTGIGT